MNEDKILNETGKSSTKRSRGFYIAVAICFIAIGVAAVTTYTSVKKFIRQDEISSGYSSGIEKQRQNSVSSSVGTTTKSNNSTGATQNAKKTETEQPKSAKKKEELLEDDQSIETKGNATGAIVYPAGKSVVKKYSGDNPVFSNTFNDWRVHNGVDFSLNQGEVVKCITDGEVKEIYDDPLLGMTVVIAHDGGFTAYYSGLGNTTLVNPKDKVESGQEIGSINDIPGETADGYHLHLSIEKDGKLVDPFEILGKM